MLHKGQTGGRAFSCPESTGPLSRQGLSTRTSGTALGLEWWRSGFVPLSRLFTSLHMYQTSTLRKHSPSGSETLMTVLNTYTNLELCPRCITHTPCTQCSTMYTSICIVYERRNIKSNYTLCGRTISPTWRTVNVMIVGNYFVLVLRPHSSSWRPVKTAKRTACYLSHN